MGNVGKMTSIVFTLPKVLSVHGHRALMGRRTIRADLLEEEEWVGCAEVAQGDLKHVSQCSTSLSRVPNNPFVAGWRTVISEAANAWRTEASRMSAYALPQLLDTDVAFDLTNASKECDWLEALL